MTAYLIPGVVGLLMGLLLHWTGFSRSAGLRYALGLRRSYTLRSGLTAVGWAMALTAFLCWLAVLDVDTIEVLPLSLGALLGGAILGIAAGLCGFTPTTAFAGLGSGNALESLCVLAGCFAGTILLPSLDALFSPLQTASPYAAATLFQVTLDEPWLLDGSFLGQACAGLLLVVIAICIPSPKPVILDVPVPDESADEASADASSAESADPEETADSDESIDGPAESADPEGTAESDESADVPDESPDPDEAADDVFVALLEGEEPLVVDTGAENEEVPESDGESPE